MSDMISVPREQWLELVLKEHSPSVTDIGDQRDPWFVVVCSCGNPGYKQAKEAGKSNLYARHLMDVLVKNGLVII
jgi:hypothetical protein